MSLAARDALCLGLGGLEVQSGQPPAQLLHALLLILIQAMPLWHKLCSRTAFHNLLGQSLAVARALEIGVCLGT